MELKNRRCIPCEGGTKPLSKKEATNYLRSTTGWKLEKGSIITNKKFKNFKEAMTFIKKVADIAEKQSHHPDIYLHDWNQVKLTLSTHAINGLSINDFIMAAKINSI